MPIITVSINSVKTTTYAPRIHAWYILNAYMMLLCIKENIAERDSLSKVVSMSSITITHSEDISKIIILDRASAI